MTRRRKPALAEMDRAAFLAWRMEYLQGILADARKSENAWTAISQITRQLDTTHAELARLRTAMPDPGAVDLAGLPPAEQERVIRENFRGAPDDVLWWAVEELQARYPGKVRVTREVA